MFDCEKTAVAAADRGAQKAAGAFRSHPKTSAYPAGQFSDRLGDVAVELPVTVLIVKFGKKRLTGDAMVNVRWHPKAAQRPVRALCALGEKCGLTLECFFHRNFDDGLYGPGIGLFREPPAHAKIEDVRLHVDVDDGIKPLVLLLPGDDVGEPAKITVILD